LVARDPRNPQIDQHLLRVQRGPGVETLWLLAISRSSAGDLSVNPSISLTDKPALRPGIRPTPLGTFHANQRMNASRAIIVSKNRHFHLLL
jgi:hypothetical protein